MDSIAISSYIVLTLITVAWCALHSGMISVRVTRLLQKHGGRHFRLYRLFFNIVALLTLIPVIVYQRSIQGEALFSWEGYPRIAQVLFIVAGIVLFLLGAKKYDARQFMGLSQLSTSNHSQSLASDGKLDTSGVHQFVRHPWYTGLLLILWARPLDISTIIINTVFSAYLLIGSWLEERKLVMEFGDAYRQYQEDVSMLLPLKWTAKKLGIK
jgi:protein-S-isoprenylcysteine O-methyltransferase Ste14